MKTKMKSLLLGVIVTLVILGAISINPAMADHIEIDNDLPLLVDPDISYHFINNTSGSVNLTPFSTSYNAFINLYDAKIFLIQNDEILYHSVHNNIGTGFAPTGFYSGQPHSPINDIDDIIIRIEVTSGYYQMTAPIDGVYSIFKSDTTGTESSPRYFSTNPTVPILQIVTITEIHEYSVFVYSDSDDTRYETSSILNNHRATFEITSDTHTITSLFPGVGYTNTASCEINGGASDTTFTVGAGDFVRCTFDYTYTEPSFDDFERSSPGLQSEFASDPIYIAPGGSGSFCDENSINIYQSMGFSAPHSNSYYESRLLVTDADDNIVYRDAIDVYKGGVDFCLNINDLPFGFDAESSSFIVEVRDTYGNGLDEWSTNGVAYNSNADDIITSFERCDDTFFRPTSIIDPNLNHDLCLTYAYGEFPMTLELKGNDGSLAGFSYTDSTLDIITYIDQFGTNKTQISFPEAATTFDLSDFSQFTAKLFFIPQDHPLDDQSHAAYPTHNSVFSLTKVVTGTDIVFTLDTETFPDDYDPIIYNTNYRLEITDTHNAGVTEGYVINYITHFLESKIHLDTYDYFKEFSHLLDDPVIDDPVIDDPVIDNPVIDNPVIDNPVIDNPVIDNPVIDNPVIDNPVIDNPVIDNPVIDNPVIDNPVIDNPVIDNPVIDNPVIDNPVIDNPVIDNPVIDNPVIDNPVIDNPVIDNPVIDRQTPEPSKKRGNGGDDGKTRPTFGISEQTLRSIVTCGYSMDGMCTDVNKYHVDYTRQSIQTGSTHDFTLKAYAHNGMKTFVIGFGVKEVGSPVSQSEAIITVNLSRDYSLDSTYVIDSVEYNNDNNVIGEDATFAISKVPCNAASNSAQCTELSISDVLFREVMYDEPFLIEAIDMKRKSTTHFMNEGLLITGDSLNDPPITELSKKISSQSGFIVYELTRTDKINNIWTDQFGYTWSESNPGNWFYVDGPKPIVSSACTNTNNRYCDVFADKIKWHTDNMENMRDSIYGDIYTIAEFDDLDDPVTLIETPGNWFYVDGSKPIVSSACTNTNNRYCDVFADKIKWHTDNMEKMRDSIYGDIYTIAEFDDLDDPVTFTEIHGNSRTQFLEDNGLMWLRK